MLSPQAKLRIVDDFDMSTYEGVVYVYTVMEF